MLQVGWAKVKDLELLHVFKMVELILKVRVLAFLRLIFKFKPELQLVVVSMTKTSSWGLNMKINPK